MSPAAGARARDMRYEPDERPPLALSAGLGLQLVLITIAGVVLTPAVVIQASGWSESYVPWAAFAALAVSGATTVLQAVRVGRVGAGYVLLMGTSGVFIAVCVTALAEGGPPLMATLVVVSSLLQFAFAARLAWFRRIVTPTVAGCVLMLISVTVMPIAFSVLDNTPEGAAPLAGPVCAAVTLVVLAAVALRSTGMWRLWAPVAGIAAGCVAAAAFGLYDMQRVAAAPWAGLPQGSWPGLDLSFGPAFWALLPAFLLATAINAIETVGDSVAIQRVSWRSPRAADFRAVQGAAAADGIGNLLSGLAGTVPNTTYSSSISVTEITRVGSRTVGVCAGVAFLAFAFLPKATALLLAIPGPVVAAYIMVLMALLFMLGARLVVQSGAGFRGAMIAGVSFWIGIGFQNREVFADRLGEWWGALLGNGMLTGGLAALLMTAFLEFSGPRRQRLETALGAAALPQVAGFLDRFASRAGWSDAMAGRLRAVGEETLHTLADRRTAGEAASERRMLLTIRRDGAAAELEFVAAPGDGNLEDRMALLGEPDAEVPLDHEISLRLLRHYASSVRHQQYHDTDIVTVRVDAPPHAAPAAPG